MLSQVAKQADRGRYLHTKGCLKIARLRLFAELDYSRY